MFDFLHLINRDFFLAASVTSTQQKPVIKRDSQSSSIKNEPMTPAIQNDSRNLKQHHQNKKHDSHRKEDRRRRRQLKATGSDEEKHAWSENDEDDLMDDDDDDEEDKSLLFLLNQLIIYLLFSFSKTINSTKYDD
jgi:hypothetical protein